jgi:hypothetical protein
MTAITLMAAALQRELLDRGERNKFTLADCEAIISAMLEKSAKAACSIAPTRVQGEDLTKRGT